MNRYPKIVFTGTMVLLMSVSAVIAGQSVQEHKVELLWPGGAPAAKGDSPGDKPTLTIYLPPKDRACGAAVVICPGGGYGHLAMDHEAAVLDFKYFLQIFRESIKFDS